MKKSIRSSFSLLTCIVACCLLVSNISYGQTFYSNFPDPTGNAYVINPTGANCSAPAAQDSLGFADTSAATLTSFKTFTTVPYTCSIYHFVSRLNLPVDTPILDAGYKAGFRIRVPTGVSLDSLRKYVILASYTSDGTLIEYISDVNILGSDSSQNGVDWYLYFMPAKPFNTLEITVDPNITPLNTNFEFDVFYAFASKDLVLPAQIANFSLATSGKNVNLSWQSLTETNVANYRIERSNNSGADYSAIATVSARGNNNTAVNYGYTDNASVNGSYLYRIVTVNKDGSSKATNSLVAIISDQGNLFLYPSVVKAGQNITVKTSENGLLTVILYDAQGRMVKQQRTASTGQFTIATNGLSAGVYHVKVTSSNGSVFTSKIIIN